MENYENVRYYGEIGAANNGEIIPRCLCECTFAALRVGDQTMGLETGATNILLLRPMSSVASHTKCHGFRLMHFFHAHSKRT